jgi:hypothetical protein
MGMNSDVALALELSKRGFFEDIDSVLDMGAQELHLTFDAFDWLVRAAGIENYDPEQFAALKNYPNHPRCSARYLWSLLGVKNYACTDIQDFHGAIKLDLNEPLEDTTLWGKHDLVTDFGNNEHAFNVGEAYRTMHRLCRPDGYMWITQAIFGGNGFYNFDEAFFEGMAAANNYGIVFSGFVVAVGDEQHHIPLSRELLFAFDLSKVTVDVSYIFKKSTDADFNFYYQMDLKKPEPRYFQIQFTPGRICERYYIPQTIEWIPGRDMVRELIRRIKQRITN